jgi:hypothetical protein
MQPRNTRNPRNPRKTRQSRKAPTTFGGPFIITITASIAPTPSSGSNLQPAKQGSVRMTASFHVPSTSPVQPSCRIVEVRLTERHAGVAELADAQDLKSWVAQAACGFDSRPRHQILRKSSGSRDQRRRPASAVWSTAPVLSLFAVRRVAVLLSDGHDSCSRLPPEVERMFERHGRKRRMHREMRVQIDERQVRHVSAPAPRESFSRTDRRPADWDDLRTRYRRRRRRTDRSGGMSRTVRAAPR